MLNLHRENFFNCYMCGKILQKILIVLIAPIPFNSIYHVSQIMFQKFLITFVTHICIISSFYLFSFSLTMAVF